MILWQITSEDQQLPLDPELFVASQPIEAPYADPWSCLALAEAGDRYKLRVRRIIRQLRIELKREVRRAEALISAGKKLPVIMRARDNRLSALGLYITAQRAGRPDLAEKLRSSAVEQHNSCPLYRFASLSLLSAELYPADDVVGSPENREPYLLHRKIASLN
jgi:hypothetical protein